MLVSWSDAMQLALAEADLAAEHGDVPVGAVLLDVEGTVVATGHNRREQTGDPTAHAEIEAIRKAAADRNHWRLSGLTLVCTLEPCPMCAGALVNARVDRLVYGATDPKAGAVHTLYKIANDPRLNHRLEIIGEIEAEACAGRLKAFFARLRAQGHRG
ncbi:MAG: nucleoside deaminase [Polyangiaceae bacterium]